MTSLDTKVAGKLARAGVDRGMLERVARVVDLPTDATDIEIDDEIARVREALPTLFTSPAVPTVRQTARRSTVPTDEALKRGAELARQRHPATPASDSPVGPSR